MDLETLKQVKFMFDLQSNDRLVIDTSIGYKALTDYIKTEEALLIQRVVVNEAENEEIDLSYFKGKNLGEPLNWDDKKSEVELLCDVDKGTKCKDPFPKYRTGVCRNCGGQSN